MLHCSDQEAGPVALEQWPQPNADDGTVQLVQTRAYALGSPGQSLAGKAIKSLQPPRPRPRHDTTVTVYPGGIENVEHSHYPAAHNIVCVSMCAACAQCVC